MTKPLYELNLPPASWFIGQYVRIVTTMEEQDGMGEVIGRVQVVGLVVDSDSMYLTLGEFSPLEETPIAHMAIKHSDIQMISLASPDDSDIEDEPAKRNLN
jgi:hypothetical protein